MISGDHYVKEHYERLRLNSNFEDVVKRVDMLFNIRKEFYPDSTTEIRISGIDNERTLDREKFRDFWIKRSDHVTASYPLERWNTYENKEDPRSMILVNFCGIECISGLMEKLIHAMQIIKVICPMEILKKKLLKKSGMER